MNQSEYQISNSELLTSCHAETRCRGLVLTNNASATTKNTSCVGIGRRQTRSRGCGSAGRTKSTCTPAKPRGASPKGTKANSGFRCTENRGCCCGCRVLSKAAYNPKIPTCSANKERKKKDPKHTKAGGGRFGGAQAAKHWVCRVLLLGLTKCSG